MIGDSADLYELASDLESLRLYAQRDRVVAAARMLRWFEEIAEPEATLVHLPGQPLRTYPPMSVVEGGRG